MNNLTLWISSGVNVLVTGLFAGAVLRQYLSRHRLYQLYWSIALCMAFLATLAYIFMLLVQPTSDTGILLFRTYYIGGTIMPAWLGMGSVALVSRPLFTRICSTVLLLLSVVGALFILDAHINLQMLSQIAGTPGTGILQPGPWLITTIILNTLGVVAVVAAALYSGWNLLRRQSRASNVLWANLLILIGAICNATAGSLARFLGIQSTFWLIMALGWIILFGGVLLANRRSSQARPAIINHSASEKQAS